MGILMVVSNPEERKLTRRECAMRARRLSQSIRLFLSEAEEYLSRADRAHLVATALTLEALASGR